MSAQTRQSIQTLLATGDGEYACPKCSHREETMDAIHDHIFSAHEPLREFILHWRSP